MILVEYSSDWPNWFERLKPVLESALGSVVVGIHHVGSTSIPGMAAKPIIDIDAVISDYDVLPSVEMRLGTLGYRNEGERGVQDRTAFRRTDEFVPYVQPPVRWINHHLYVCPRYSRELWRHLAFKEYLTRNRAAREEYLRIKKEIESESRDDAKLYASMKEERARGFVQQILRKCPQNMPLDPTASGLFDASQAAARTDRNP